MEIVSDTFNPCEVCLAFGGFFSASFSSIDDGTLDVEMTFHLSAESTDVESAGKPLDTVAEMIVTLAGFVDWLILKEDGNEIERVFRNV